MACDVWNLGWDVDFLGLDVSNLGWDVNALGLDASNLGWDVDALGLDDSILGCHVGYCDQGCEYDLVSIRPRIDTTSYF